MKTNETKKMKKILIAIGIIVTIWIIADVLIFTECYSTTMKYQLKNDLERKEQTAIDLYENLYVNHNRDLFKDNFAMRNCYAEQKSEKQAVVFEEITPPKTLKSIGIYTITAYCPCQKCSEGWGRKTASGKTAKANHTIAAPKNIPFGTILIIDGKEYVVEDRGGAIKGKKLDMFFDTHRETLNWGKKKMEVYAYE